MIHRVFDEVTGKREDVLCQRTLMTDGDRVRISKWELKTGILLDRLQLH